MRLLSHSATSNVRRASRTDHFRPDRKSLLCSVQGTHRTLHRPYAPYALHAVRATWRTLYTPYALQALRATGCELYTHYALHA